jgi:transcriptional regulator with XRE-family HTH domain
MKIRGGISLKNNDESRYILGERLEELRGKNSIEKVSKDLGKNRYTYRGWETGYRTPKGNNLILLAKYYNTTVDYLLGKTDDPEQINEIELSNLVENFKPTLEGKPLTDEQARILMNAVNKITRSASKLHKTNE